MDNAVAAFDMDRCHVVLNYPYALENMTLANLKKAFTLMFIQYWRNADAIALTEEYLDLCIQEVKGAEAKSKKSYTDGYKTTAFDIDLTPAEKRKIESQNKKLLQAVAQAKKARERMEKVKAVYFEVKQKYKT